MEVLSKKLKSVRVCDVWPVGLFFIEVADIEALGHVVIYSYFIKTRFDGGSTKTPKSTYPTPRNALFVRPSVGDVFYPI